MKRAEALAVVLVLCGAIAMLFRSNPGTTLLASAMLRAQGATAALAYLDEYDCYGCGDTWYYDEQPAEPDTIYYSNESDPSGTTVEPDYWPVSDEPIDYYGGPLDNTTVYVDPTEYPDAPLDTTTYYYDDTPWYVDAFPGFGQLAMQILPPILQPSAVVQPVAPQPSCTMAAQPSTVAAGGSTVVSWTAHNASRVTLSGVGDVAGTGSRTYSGLSSSQAFSLTVSGPGGTNYCSTQVQVQQSAAKPTCLISAHPSLIHRGESADIAWTSQNAVRLYLGSSAVAQSGGTAVSPQQSTTYTLTVYNQAGDMATCAVPLTVQ